MSTPKGTRWHRPVTVSVTRSFLWATPTRPELPQGDAVAQDRLKSCSRSLCLSSPFRHPRACRAYSRDVQAPGSLTGKPGAMARVQGG